MQQFHYPLQHSILYFWYIFWFRYVILCYWKQNILAMWNNMHRNNIQFDFIYFWMTRGFVFVDGKVWIGNIFFHKISLVFLNSLLDIWSMTSIDGSLQRKTIWFSRCSYCSLGKFFFDDEDFKKLILDIVR